MLATNQAREVKLLAQKMVYYSIRLAGNGNVRGKYNEKDVFIPDDS
jgi:hypothetical protein